MSTLFDSYDLVPNTISWTYSGKHRQSAGATATEGYNFLDFLGIAQILSVDFLPITWQPALGDTGEGGSATTLQSRINAQTSFVFKRLKVHGYATDDSQIMGALVAELSILGRPVIRRHPHITTIEGICWDVASDDRVWPVLVFRKIENKDLGQFITTNAGRSLSFDNRIDMLYDVALATRDLHASGIIHGDIKPANVLISSGEDHRHMAIMTDFGYSTLFATENDIITMPYSRIWSAPEYHHRGFLPLQARKMDTYSFGMLCLWLLFYNIDNDSDHNFRKIFNSLRKEALDHALELLRARSGLEDYNKEKLRRLFNVSLPQDPAKRAVDFTIFLRLLSPYRMTEPASTISRTDVPPHEFDITLSFYQLVESPYSVRQYIAKSLDNARMWFSRSKISKLNLGFCYNLGFGVPQDQAKCHQIFVESCESLHKEFDRGIKDVRKRNFELQHIFHEGTFRTLLEQGQFTACDFSHEYNKQGQSLEAEETYIREVESMRVILGDEHVSVQELRRQLSLLMISQGRRKDAENVLLDMIEIQKRTRVSGQDSAEYLPFLAEVYANQGRHREAEELDVRVLEKRVHELGEEGTHTLNSVGSLAMSYLDQGRSKEAEELNMRVVKASTRILGEEHMTTMVGTNNLSLTYKRQGRLTEALRLLIQVKETMEKALGCDHPHTLTSMHNLAFLHKDKGAWKRAEDLWLIAIDRMRTVMGTSHPRTLACVDYLADMYKHLGRWKEAEELGASKKGNDVEALERATNLLRNEIDIVGERRNQN